MERCYVCNHCGRCEDEGLRFAAPELACLDCGHVVQPGESPARCAACGGECVKWTRKTPEVDRAL